MKTKNQKSHEISIGYKFILTLYFLLVMSLFIGIALLTSCSVKDKVLAEIEKQESKKIPFAYFRNTQSFGNIENRYHHFECYFDDHFNPDHYRYDVSASSKTGDAFVAECQRTYKSNVGIIEVEELYKVKRTGTLNPNGKEWVEEIEVYIKVRANYYTDQILEGVLEFPDYEESFNLLDISSNAYTDGTKTIVSFYGQLQTKNETLLDIDITWRDNFY